MKVKTSELQGAALDWAVATAEGLDISVMGACVFLWVGKDSNIDYEPSTYWAHGGPIIEREWLDVTPWPNESDEDLRWQCKQHDSIECVAFGPTPLIVAMRCYVASKLGDEVELPEELNQ